MSPNHLAHLYSTVHTKVMYVHEHSGDGAIVHEAGHLAGIMFGYNRLIEKELANPIMGKEKLAYYQDKLLEYIKKSEKFLTHMVANV